MAVELMIGQVDLIRVKDKSYSFTIRDKDSHRFVWFSAFKGKPHFEKGDEVEVYYELSEDGRWRNAKDIKVLQKALEFKPANLVNSKESQMLISDKQKTISALTSYAKDVVIALIEKAEVLETKVNIDQYWTDAIDGVIGAYNRMKGVV